MTRRKTLIALWLALVAFAESGEQAMRANNSLERSREP